MASHTINLEDLLKEHNVDQICLRIGQVDQNLPYIEFYFDSNTSRSSGLNYIIKKYDPDKKEYTSQLFFVKVEDGVSLIEAYESLASQIKQNDKNEKINNAISSIAGIFGELLKRKK